MTQIVQRRVAYEMVTEYSPNFRQLDEYLNNIYVYVILVIDKHDFSIHIRNMSKTEYDVSQVLRNMSKTERSRFVTYS